MGNGIFVSHGRHRDKLLTKVMGLAILAEEKQPSREVFSNFDRLYLHTQSWMANKAVWRGEKRSFYAVGQNESKPYWISNERQD